MDKAYVNHNVVLYSQLWRYRGADKSLAPTRLKKQLKGGRSSSARRSFLPRRSGWTDSLMNFYFWVACKS